jgi:type II secretory pathway predicted ATPase ExeA
VNTPTVPEPQERRLLAHFGLTKLPFRKNVHAADMFQSRAQQALLHGLNLFLEVRGLAVVTGPSGVGKSITLRRFVQGLDESRVRPIHLPIVPTTAVGFVRTLNRVLGLPMRAHAADLFNQAQQHLIADQGPHTLLVVDDAEGCRPEWLDLLRRLTAYALDGEDRFSILVSGTEELLTTFRGPGLEPLRSRVAFAHALRPFQEALAAVRVLRQAVDAIWEVHGERMVAEIEAGPDRWRLDELVDVPEIDDVDDIPF